MSIVQSIMRPLLALFSADSWRAVLRGAWRPNLMGPPEAHAVAIEMSVASEGWDGWQAPAPPPADAGAVREAGTPWWTGARG